MSRVFFGGSTATGAFCVEFSATVVFLAAALTFLLDFFSHVFSVSSSLSECYDIS